MNLSFDAYYTIGKTHLFCQDYAVYGAQPFPHIILADGCSAAPNSDLGARLLVLNARRFLPYYLRGMLSECNSETNHWRLGLRIIRRAARQARDLGLDLDVLDATLLIAWCAHGFVHIHLYGDGCIATRNHSGDIAVIRVEYAENAPYYLSYLLDAERGALYREALGAEPHTAQSIYYHAEGGTTCRQAPYAESTQFRFKLATFPTVAVATDGLHSLVNADSGERMDVLETAQRFLDFPNLERNFVKRQTHQALFAYSQQRVVNLDDLGWGAFVQTG